MSIPETELPQAATAAAGLRRNLKLWQVVAVSIGVMAPSLAISLEPQGAVSTVGRAIPLTYLLALVGVLLVSYGFARLAQRFHHSGAVYGLVGATIGPRSGVVSAWALTGTYTFYSLLTAMAVGIFGSSLLETWGVWQNPPSWAAYLLAVVTLLVCTWLAIVPVKRGTSVVLICEAITVTLILIGAVVVFVRLAGGSAPGHQHFTMSVFSPAPGTSPSSLFIGVVFGFLSFAGFEAAAVFGAEAERPRPQHPARHRRHHGRHRAVLPGGRDGVDDRLRNLGPAGRRLRRVAFADGNPGIVLHQPVVRGPGHARHRDQRFQLHAGVRRGRVPDDLHDRPRRDRRALGARQGLARYGTPVTASLIVVAAALAGAAIFGWGMSAAPFDVFVWTSTIGTLLLLVVYLIVTAAAIKVLFFSGDSTVARWEIVIPVLAAVVLIYTLYKNIHPAGEPNWEPITALVWLVLALVALVVAPRVTTRWASGWQRTRG